MKGTFRSHLLSTCCVLGSALVAPNGCVGGFWDKHQSASDNPDNGLAPEAIEAGLPLIDYLVDKPLAALDDAPAPLRELLLNEDGQRFMTYVVGGALDSSKELAVRISDGSADMTIQWHGELGLCPQWAFRAPSEACLRHVTGYLLASLNAQELSVPISLRGAGVEPVGKVPVQGTFREDRGTRIASFERCMDPGAAALEGARRNCGWTPRYVGMCTAHQEVTLGLHIDITEPGAIQGASDVMLRVSDNIYGSDDPKGANRTPGGERSYAGMNETVRIGSNGRVTFVCPENGPSIEGVRYGYFGIMLAAADPNRMVSAGIDVKPLTGVAVYPAGERQVFTRREGVFWGNLSGGFDEQHACHDEDWNEDMAQATGRVCLLPGWSCFPNPVRPCGSVEAEFVNGFAVYVNDPGDR